MCRKRLAKRDSVDYSLSKRARYTGKIFLKNSLPCYVTINVQVKREKLVTCRHTHTTNSPISILPACRRLLFPLLPACNKGNRRRLHAGKFPISQKNDWHWGILSATPVTAGCFNKFVVVVKAQGVEWETEGLPVEKRKTI